MKLFNKRCWMGHNGVVGITLKVLLLLLATNVTYADGLLSYGEGLYAKSKYQLWTLEDVRDKCNSLSEGQAGDMDPSKAIMADQATSPFLGRIVSLQEPEKEFEYVRYIAAGLTVLALNKGATCTCIRRDGRYYVKASGSD